MKKIFSAILAVMMVFVIAASVAAVEPFTSINVPKCTTAPVADGVINAGEYKLISTYDKADAAWNRDSTGMDDISNPVCNLYATWDDTNFYVAVKATCTDPTHPQGFNKYVFEQPSLMTAMVYDDPTLTQFLAATGEDWDWGDAYATTFGREWTIGKLADGTPLDAAACNHFGAVRSDANFKFESKCADGYDVYEEAIPWSAIGKTDAKEGAFCGFAISCCMKTVTQYDTDGNAVDGSYACFASGISGSKSFQRYAKVTLTANEPFEESTAVESTADVSTATSETDNVPTGDNVAIFAIIAVIALAGATVVVSKVRK